MDGVRCDSEDTQMGMLAANHFIPYVNLVQCFVQFMMRPQNMLVVNNEFLSRVRAISHSTDISQFHSLIYSFKLENS